jgi:hypothetical protein
MSNTYEPTRCLKCDRELSRGLDDYDVSRCRGGEDCEGHRVLLGERMLASIKLRAALQEISTADAEADLAEANKELSLFRRILKWRP